MTVRTSFEATVRRWGNTLALRLPRRAVTTLDLEEGDTVDLTIAKSAGPAMAGGGAQEEP